jgi:succinate dehydrogenase / fumarate reductase, iron-sulfur subunit
MQTVFKVSRFDPATDGKSQVMTYPINVSAEATVLDGLKTIRDEYDSSLAFRGNCERGSCGDCALRVNKKGVLGCTTKITAVMGKDGVVTVEPIRNVPVLKDLVYDMDTFLWRKVKAVSPGITAPTSEPLEEYAVPEEAMAKVRSVMSCVMCGLCDEGCTVVAVDGNFVGPAALTKAYRAIFDPRDSRQAERLRSISEPTGVWDCTHCFESLMSATRQFVKGYAPERRIQRCDDTTTVFSNLSKGVAGSMKGGWRWRVKGYSMSLG